MTISPSRARPGLRSWSAPSEVSPSELVELYLERIARLEPELNAYRVVLADGARADAKRAEERLAKGEEAPLLGVPVAIKDNVDYAGEVTTHGTAAYGEPAAEDGLIVRRLREAGASILGKTTLPELAIFGFTESPAWGDTRNPWDTSRTPAGSSGGSGAATAAGMCAIAHATDGAGSIRYPAANCGLFGLKPQRNRISLWPDREHWYGLSVSGCVSRTVMDTALYLDAMSGPERGDFDSPPPLERPLAEAARTSPGKLRIACTTKTILPCQEGARGPRGIRGDRGVAALPRARGDGGLPELWPDVHRLLSPLLPRDPRRGADASTSGAALRPDEGVRQARAPVQRPPPGEGSRPHGRGGRRIGELFRGLRRADHAGHGAAPGRDRALARPRRPADDQRDGNVYPYAATWNYTGQPAATIPAGFSEGGLPRSVMLVARPNEEGTLVSLAAQLEAERPWADRRP